MCKVEVKSYVDNLNRVQFTEMLQKKMEDLYLNMVQYEGAIHAETLVSEYAGQHMSRSFLEMLEIPEEEISTAEEQGYIDNLASEYMDSLANELHDMCEEMEFDLDGYDFYVGYLDEVEGIHVVLTYERWDEIAHLDSDEYDMRRAIAEEFDCEVADIVDLSDDTYQICGREYLIIDDDTANEKCKDYIQDNLWTFYPHFLSSETGFSEEIFEAIICTDVEKDKNDAIYALIESGCGIDNFVESAIRSEGRGHFLSSYNGYEIELNTEETLYAYRLD